MKTYSQLRRDVSAERQWESSVHVARIGVKVKDGALKLAGQADGNAQKLDTGGAAQHVASVQAMTTGLNVHLTCLSQRTDADIAESVKSVLEWTPALPLDAIQVTVRDGWVTLSGTVDWQYQRQAAADSMRRLTGVKGISNQIGILSLVPDAAVKSDIEAALKRSSIADANAISVAVRGGEVTLSGTVHSRDERNTATYSTWGTLGVRNVVDTVKLAY